MKTTYKTNFELLREEISKDIIDKKHCRELIYSLEYDRNQIDDEIYDLEDELSDLKQDVKYMESEIESLNRNNRPSPPSMLDSYYKNKVFIELSEKYSIFTFSSDVPAQPGRLLNLCAPVGGKGYILNKRRIR